MKKVAITVEKEALAALDMMVSDGLYPSRSAAIQQAIEEKLQNLQRLRLYMESAKLNRTEEQAIAEGLGRHD